MLKAITAALRNLYKPLQKYVRNCKRRANEHRFERGYAEAMSLLTKREMSPEYLYLTTETAEVLNRFTSYHEGVRSAVQDFKLSGACA